MWILIVLATVVGGEGGRSLESVEFSSKATCMNAMKATKARTELIKDAFCVPK